MDPTALRNMVMTFLTDICVIRGRGTELAFVDGAYVPGSLGPVVYTGLCRVRTLFRASGTGTVLQVGEAPVPIGTFEVKLPYDGVGIHVDQTLTVIVSDDAQLEGRTVRILDVQAETDAAYRQLICEDFLTVEQWEVGS